MSRLSFSAAIATLDIGLGKNTFHLVGQDERGAITPLSRRSNSFAEPGQRQPTDPYNPSASFISGRLLVALGLVPRVL
jgi:hypothetical protein